MQVKSPFVSLGEIPSSAGLFRAWLWGVLLPAWVVSPPVGGSPGFVVEWRGLLPCWFAGGVCAGVLGPVPEEAPGQEAAKLAAWDARRLGCSPLADVGLQERFLCRCWYVPTGGEKNIDGPVEVDERSCRLAPAFVKKSLWKFLLCCGEVVAVGGS